MKRLSPIQKALFLTVLAYPLMAIEPLLAEDQDLQETLQRMEQLLQQQQEELEAQRRELAEQRELIRQLQQEQRTAAEEAAPGTADQPPSTPVVVSREAEEPAPAPATDVAAAPSTPVPETEGPETEAPEPGSAKEQSLAELSRRERAGEDQVVSAQTPEDDPSNTTYDPDFPGAWHLPGTTASMKIAGYVNLALVNSFDPMLISDRFIVGSIPPEDQDVPGAKSGTDVTANQTRINYEVREETRHGTLRAFIEADFEGDGDTFRLRHAFGQYRWALAGKTWSTFMDTDSRPEEVDFEGINGMILSRQAQVRLFPDFGRKMSFKLGLEDPSTDVVNGVGARGSADVVMSVDRVPFRELGNWNYRVAIILRDLEADLVGPGGVEQGGDDTYGWGITTSGRTPFGWWGDEDFLLWQVTYGEGVGRYINDLGTVGGGDAVFDPQGKLQALPVFAGYVSYRHTWAKDFWFLKSWPGILRSNLTYSWVCIDNYDFQDDRDYKGTQRISANMIYLPTQNLRLGVELLWGERKNKDNSKGTANQLQISARYNF
jgi:hypothetical protein